MTAHPWDLILSKLPLYRPCLHTQSHAEMLGVSTSADEFGKGWGTTTQSITTVSFTAPNTLEQSLSFSLPSSLLLPLPSTGPDVYVDSSAIIQSWKDLRPNNEIALLAQGPQKYNQYNTPVYGLMFWCRYTLLKSSSLPRCWCTITLRSCCPFIIISPILSHPLTMWCLRCPCIWQLSYPPYVDTWIPSGQRLWMSAHYCISSLNLVE